MASRLSERIIVRLKKLALTNPERFEALCKELDILGYEQRNLHRAAVQRDMESFVFEHIGNNLIFSIAERVKSRGFKKVVIEINEDVSIRVRVLKYPYKLIPEWDVQKPGPGSS